MKKQNSALLLLVAIVFFVVGYILYQEGKLAIPGVSQESVETALDQITNSNQVQELLGDAVEEASPEEVEQKELQKSFAVILDDISECLTLKIPTLAEDAPVSVDAMVMQFQSEFGPAAHQSDRWMNWHLRNRDGKERRIRLEVSESDEGTVSRHLNYFAVDRDGQPVTIDIPEDRQTNPSDEILNHMLKEGEVFYKDKAAYVLFSNGERLEYIEKNGSLSEFELVKGEKFFRCENLKNRESCRCMN